jgi:DtxR family Mn-dependent transcriptional regulator
MPDPLTALLIGSLFLLSLTLLFWPNGGLIGHLQRVSQYSTRIRREDALKHIQKAESHGGKPTLESVAGSLNIRTSQAAELLTGLQDQGLVVLEADSFRLTSSGREYALQIIRAHRLLERYLAEQTGYKESEWHELADRFEHQYSPDTLANISAQLGNPTHDPHGDPIPTIDGEIVMHGGKPLTDMALDVPLRIVHIEDEPEHIYAQLAAEGLYPGLVVTLIEQTPQRVKFLADGAEHILAPIFASNISVLRIQQEDIQEAPCVGESLDALKPGQSGQVIALSPRLRGADRRRMMDLGILPGTMIHAEMNGPSGDPKAYRIRGALIALRHEQAQLIRINPNTTLEIAL